MSIHVRLEHQLNSIVRPRRAFCGPLLGERWVHYSKEQTPRRSPWPKMRSSSDHSDKYEAKAIINRPVRT